ncbi:glycoside hydrolase family 38 C-terminal domain-containing protein [Aeromonas sp. 164P]
MRTVFLGGRKNIESEIMSKTYHVISHTHWDYEWYFTQNESLIQLVYHMDELMTALEQGELNSYLLDGQLSIVEDYLAICPENKTRFSDLVRAGKLKIGPWYTQTDQLIIGGESILRNLMMGMQMADEFGACIQIGYVPDAFGQSIDMPKIYKGVGIDKTVFWRGLSSDKCSAREFNWRCEDGSEVLAYNIKNGYFPGSHIMGYDDPTPLTKMLSEGALAQNIVLPLGGDQRYVDFGLKQRIEIANQFSQEQTLVESSYEEFFAALAQEEIELPTLSGELIDGQVSKIHRSIYSSRYDHKYLNDLVERNLTLQLEPLMLMARQQGIANKLGLTAAIWRCLMRNHAHDSAGGCNTDKTNKIILARYEQAQQMLASTTDYLVRKMAISQAKNSADMGGKIVLFNTLPYQRDVVQRLNIATQNERFSLFNQQGESLSFDIVDVRRCYRGSIKRTMQEQDESLYYYQSEIELRCTLPASSMTQILVQESTSLVQSYLASVAEEVMQIENDAFIMQLQQGQFSLYDKARQVWWCDCLQLIDMGDDGDTYDYSPPQQDWLLSLDWRTAKCQVVTGQSSSRMTLSGRWNLPQDLAARAAQKLNAHVDYQVEISLKQGRDATQLPLEFTLHLDNQVCDHRMQLVFNLPNNFATCWADTPFGVVERESVPQRLAHWRELGWKEEPSAIYPMLHFANVHDADLSVSVLSKGIKEYEMRGENQLALTLYRSVGWLGKPDLQRRPGIASGQQFKYIATPDSQLLGELRCELALLLEQRFDAANVQRIWQNYAVDPLYYQEQELNLFTNTMRYFVTHPVAENTMPVDGFEVMAEQLVLSAIKPSECGNGVTIRLYNPCDMTIAKAGYLQLPAEIQSVCETNLLEQPCGTRQSVQGRFELGGFKPKQIKTFTFLF